MFTRQCRMAVLALAGSQACAQYGGPAVLSMGDLPGGPTISQAYGWGSLGGDPVMVGESRDANGSWAVLWKQHVGLRNLGTLAPTDQFSRATACSLGTQFVPGGVVVGHSGFAPSVFECRAFRWTESGGMQPIPAPAGGGSADLALGISDDGGAVVGQAGVNGAPRAFKWGLAPGTIVLGPLPGGDTAYSSADGISGNGQVAVGHARDAALTTHAVRWPTFGQAQSLGHLNSLGFQSSRAYACSNDGTVIVGESTSPNGPQEAFRWAAGGGMVGLGDLPGGEFRSVALAVSHDGSVVAGWSETFDGPRAFVWSQAAGMRDATTLVQGWQSAPGWRFIRVHAVAGGNGQLGLSGVGINPQGSTDGFFASAYACYPDCNTDSALNLADFGCFQTAFASNNYADCNRDGLLNLSDFGCFQTHFALGCR